MSTLITWMILLILCLLAGFLTAFYNFNLNFIVIVVVLYILAFVLQLGRNFYIFNLSKNMKEVENYLHKYKKRPYMGFIIAMLNGENVEAQKKVSSIKNEQQRFIGEVSLLVHQKEFEFAKVQNKKIKNEDVRLYNNALLALKEGDWGQFETLRDGVQKPVFKKVLDTEEAFKRGEFEKAERLGDEAISLSKGLQRLILIQSLEREQKNPHRDSFF